MRIEVGYGLEGVLPDAIAKRIIEETIVPRLKQGDFAGGIDAGIDKIMGVIAGRAAAAARRQARAARRCFQRGGRCSG